MRHTAQLFAIALAFALPSGLLAQAVYFKSGNKEEKWNLNDPFAPKGAATDKKKAFWKNREITLETGSGVETSRKLESIVRIEWPVEPAPMVRARDQVQRGDSEDALRQIEPVLRLFDPVRKTPGSLWLKAAEIKLDALGGLTNATAVASFIATLEEADDGSVPGLASKLKLAKLNLRVRSGDNTSVVIEADKLLEDIKEPDMIARLLITKADSLLALRKYEEALNTYLRVTVFYGSEKSFIAAAYLGAAKALRGLDTPATHEQRLDLASAGYLREVIRDFPLSKEAGEAKSLLPREERVAEDKRLEAISSEKKTEAAPKPVAEDKPEATEDKPAADAKTEEKTATDKPAEAPKTPAAK